MITVKTRTGILTLVTALSIAGAGVGASVAQATTKSGDLKEKGYTCEHTATNMTVCTDKEGHEWYCEESTDECQQVKLVVGKGVKVHLPGQLLNAPVVSAPPVVTPPVITTPVVKGSLTLG